MSQENPNDDDDQSIGRQTRWVEYGDEQRQVPETASAVPDEMVFSDTSEAYEYPVSEIATELETYGLMPEAVGQTPEDIDAKYLSNIYKYQFFTEYLYEAGSGEDYTETAPIQWRTTIFTIGQPADALIEFISDHIHGRLKTLFDTAGGGQQSYEDYFTNWAPFDGYNRNVEGPRRVGPGDVTGALCVPILELEIYDENDPPNLRGEARGYADPFRLIEHASPAPPQQEQFKIGKNTARGKYEFQPTGNARRRLSGTTKSVFLNGYLIGNVQRSRGTIELAMDYDGDGTNLYRGKRYHSRQWLIDNGEFHPNAIRKGGSVWKVAEDEDSISLMATKPDGFDPTPEDAVDPTATGAQTRELALTPDQPTRMVVRADNKIYGALGYYDPVVERQISEETKFDVRDPATGDAIPK